MLRFSAKASWFFILGVLLASPFTVRAIVTGSTTDTSDPGSSAWNYVGTVNGASGVYLGAYNGTYWVLTAGHVGLGDFTLAGTTYSAVSGSALSISNIDSSLADLTLYQIGSSAGLSNLTLVSSDRPTGTSVEMIGYGGGKSWGTNTIYGYTNYTVSNTSFGGRGIVTLASDGAQGVGGDSGGGMFYYNGSTWVLSGILSGVGTITNGSTDLGNGTISVDLASYSSQILSDISAVSAIPEPAVLSLGLGSAMLGLACWRRRRAS